jgi:hypothetical protein
MTEESEIERILGLKTIAVVGLSKNPEKPSHYVPKYMKENGYTVIPVNPTAEEILGEKSYKNLLEVPDRIDIVNVFRPSQEAVPIARDAIAKKAKVLWMQEGIVNEDAARIAKEGGLMTVMDRCMMKEHKRLLGKKA